MMLTAASRLNVDLPASYVVGDYIWDIQAGQSVGCTTVGIGDRIPPNVADMTANCFRKAAELILADTTSRPHTATNPAF